MLRNYLKVAYRNILKRKLFSGINIFGLALAMGASLLLLLTSFHLLSFDRFHEDSDRIYQVYRENYPVTGTTANNNGPAPLKAALEEEFPELEQVVRWMGGGASVVYEDQAVESGIRLTDPGFLDLFSFELLRGDRATALSDPSKVVLSEQAAEKIFGQVDPLGKSIKLVLGNYHLNLQVSGILADAPINSSLQYELITRIENHPNYERLKDEWSNEFLTTFLRLPPQVTADQIEEQLVHLTHKYYDAEIAKIKKDGAAPDAAGEVVRLKLLPLADLNFSPVITNDGISRALPYGLVAIAFFILAIVCINFINLTLGSALSRAREVGVRKVMGASRGQLTAQFLGETFLIIFIALIAGVVLAQWLLPDYNRLFRQSIRLDQPQVVLAVGTIILVIGSLGALYPALVLSKFQPASVLKGITSLQKPGRLRNWLIVSQFTFSVFLIICTMVVWKQIHFMRTKPLGYNKESVISIPIGNQMNSHVLLDRLRNELAADPTIVSITGSYGNLGLGKDGSRVTSVYGFEQEGKNLKSHYSAVDIDYFKTLDIPILAGRAFSRAHPTDTVSAIIINETLAQQLGNGASVVGEKLDISNPPREIIGVMADYHFQPLDKPIEPLSLVLGTSSSNYRLSYAFVRINSDNLLRSMSKLEKTWKQINPQGQFAATFLTENNDRQYAGEQAIAKIFTSATILAIVLSCMGLFGIAVLVVAQRTKEIGIRKVLGASVAHLVGLISREFILLVGLAILLASPVAWLLLRKWLASYAYSISFPWWVLLVTSGLALGVAFLTLCYHAFRAATVDPVESLRSE